MSLNKNLGLLLLGIWLVVMGLFSLLPVGGAVIGIIVNVLALVAGLVILFLWSAWTARIGMVVLGIWLIFSALLSLLNTGFAGSGVILAGLAIVAGIAILIERESSLRSDLGILFLCIWLIVTGLLGLFSLGFTGSGPVLAVLAIVAGVLILLNE